MVSSRCSLHPIHSKQAALVCGYSWFTEYVSGKMPDFRRWHGWAVGCAANHGPNNHDAPDTLHDQHFWRFRKYLGVSENDVNIMVYSQKPQKPLIFRVGYFQTSPACRILKVATVVHVSSSHSSLTVLYPTKALWAPEVARAEWPFEQQIGKIKPRMVLSIG